MITYAILSALVNGTTSLILAGFVISKKRNKTNINFSLFSLSVAFWSFAYFLWQISITPTDALLWAKILTVGSIFIPIFYLKFTLAFLNLLNKKINKIIILNSYILTAFLLLISPSGLLVKNVTKKLSFKFWPDAGSLYWLFLLMFGSFTLYSIFLYIINYKKSSGSYKEQIKFLLLGTGIGFLGGSTNFLLWYNVPIPPIGNILVSLYVFFTAYAIVTHHLMDIKLVLRKSTVFLLSLLTILIPAVLIEYVSIRFFMYVSTWIDIGILVLAIAAYPYIKNYFFRLANKYFFSSLYDSQEVISDISNKLRTTLEIDKIYDYIYETLSSAYHLTKFGILSYDKKTNEYIVKYNRGFETRGRKRFSGNKQFHKKFISKNECIIVEEVKHSLYNKDTKQLIDLLTDLKVEILAPLNIKDKTVGLLALGPKESRDIYNEEDLKLLEIVGAQAATAIENALLYEESKSFTIKLKKEVAKATKELRKANQRLTQLDKAKSEFISIASHQLRTPLTVIKGYISMFLEKDFGRINSTQEENLEKVYQSNERLIQLVENLLNISRIESGRLQFTFENMRLEEITDSVIDELQGNAKKKKLKLIYQKPKKLLPKLTIDEEKIRQVVMNLIDNAIKYTKKGTVTVSLIQNNNNIRFCVADTGMGINKKDQTNLFKKFSRGQGSSIVHTEGTGLGLYVADQMIKAHKGKIWAESKGENQGSKFCFELPIHK